MRSTNKNQIFSSIKTEQLTDDDEDEDGAGDDGDDDEHVEEVVADQTDHRRVVLVSNHGHRNHEPESDAELVFCYRKEFESIRSSVAEWSKTLLVRKLNK